MSTAQVVAYLLALANEAAEKDRAVAGLQALAWQAAFAIWLERCRASGLPDDEAIDWWDDPHQRRFRRECLAAALDRAAACAP